VGRLISNVEHAERRRRTLPEKTASHLFTVHLLLHVIRLSSSNVELVTE
jgi:hypothetical protein